MPIFGFGWRRPHANSKSGSPSQAARCPGESNVRIVGSELLFVFLIVVFVLMFSGITAERRFELCHRKQVILVRVNTDRLFVARYSRPAYGDLIKSACNDHRLRAKPDYHARLTVT